MEDVQNRAVNTDETRTKADAEFVRVYSQNDQYEDILIHPVIFDCIGDPAGTCVVDYGCGEGGLAFKLASRGAAVNGFDVSREMILSARRKWAGPALSFDVVSDNRIPLENLSVDSVVSNLVLMMIPSIDGVRQVVNESYRVLKCWGKLVFTITNPSFVDKDFSTYRNIFDDRFRYDEIGQPYQFVLKNNDGKEITDTTFRDYHYRWEDYINAVADSGLVIKKVREIIVPENEYPPYVAVLAVKP